MQHIKPTSKGDPLCPLGFHPQVRWPTRCKRCFRDYKEHGNRNRDQDAQIRRDELTVSTPALSTYSRFKEEPTIPGNTIGSRTWTSSSNLSRPSNLGYENTLSDNSSWTSSPNLVDTKKDDVTSATVSITLPRRRKPQALEEPPPREDTALRRRTAEEDSTKYDSNDDYRRTQYTVRRRTSPSLQGSNEPQAKSSSYTNSASSSSGSGSTLNRGQERTETERRNNGSDVDFIFRVKSSNQGRDATKAQEVTSLTSTKNGKPSGSSDSTSSTDSDEESTTGTETTETTIVNANEQQLQEEIDSLKRDLEAMKSRCEKAEREKSDILLRRLANYETTTSKTTASEVLKLQQKCNELKTSLEDVVDERKVLSLKVRELEAELEALKATDCRKEVGTLRDKLAAAEALCEELMEENEDMKKEMRGMEEEMLEMQDNFREDQADEYSSMKKELEQTTKNCRILSFKLRKAERKSEQLEAEKLEAERKLREIVGGQTGLDKAERIRQLEHELSVANEAASRLQKDLEDATNKLKNSENQYTSPGKKKAPMLGSIAKTPSGEKVSRASLTRGGSQEDPVQLLRDLQDSLEREADLREQMRQAEEEAQSLQKKVSRIEDDNESLLLQLKKMAAKARTRRLSPTAQRLDPNEKDEGISDEEDPAELRLQLELNEQEAAVLRRKVEELESEGDVLKRKVNDLQDKLASAKLAETKPMVKKTGVKRTDLTKTGTVYEQKMKVMDDEMSELRKKLIEKDRECERLHAEMSIGVKKPKILQKSKSLDGDQQTVDLKRQLQLVETEAGILRTRIQSLEADNEKLQVENKRMTLVKATKRAGSAERSGSANGDDNSRLAVLEKQLEESKNKIKELEKNNVTGGAKKETTVAIGENEKLKNQMKKLETEKKKLEESLKRLEDSALSESINFYKKRTPRVPSEVTTKLQMKRMVEESEKEIGELIVMLKTSEDEKKSVTEVKANKEEMETLKDELEKTKWKLQLLINQNKEEYRKRDEESDTLHKYVRESEEEKNKQKKETEKYKTQLEKEKQKHQDVKNDLEKQKKTYTEEIANLKEEMKKAKHTATEITDLKGKLETANTELSEMKKRLENAKKQLDEAVAVDLERNELKKQIEVTTKRSGESDKKQKELEDKLKKSEKLLASKKDKLSKLEKEKEAANLRVAELEKEKTDVMTKRQEAESRIVKLEKELASKNTSIEQLESSIKGEKDSELKQRINEQLATAQEMSRLQEELHSSAAKIQQLEEQLEKKELEQKETEDLVDAKEKTLKNEINQWEKKASELEMDLQAERKMMERLKSAQEKEMKSKDLELAQLKSSSHSAGAKKIAEVKQELQAQIDRLEQALASEKHEYDELTGKYEQLEEEHVVMKAQLVKEKEKLHGQLLKTERELVETAADLKTLKETFNNKQDGWIKEKLLMQEKLKEVEVTIEKWQLERTRLQAICDEKQSELEQLRKEAQSLADQTDSYRKENEELRKNMEDYEKVAKIHRTMTADTSALDKELKEAKAKLVAEEKARKSDISALKLRYENRVSVISREMENTQGQLVRFKKERDAFKHMVDAAQKTIAELKSNQQQGIQTNRLSYEGEDPKEQLAVLEQQVSCLEDELSEARVEASRLRTELVSERSAWEVHLSELTSKLNEMEEEKILSSGRTKITGLKTKMELAWQKEREEQHRILQETATLARDLRQTLFEVERERDKERLEAKRRLDQQRKSAEEEQEEIRKKLNEMQCDLLELRDAHAKLRTTNEKIRREKERWEREKDMLKQSLAAKKRTEQEDERRIISVAQLVQELTTLAPDLFPSKPRPAAGLPTPPIRRKGSKSRETSPALERKDYSRESSVGREDAKTQEVQEIVTRLSEAAQQLRKHKSAVEDRQAARRAFSSSRAASNEPDGGTDPSVKRDASKKRANLRKSLSLEQTAAQEQAIWKLEDDKEGSLASMHSLEDLDKLHVHQRRDPSLDSRLSGGSTKSEMLPSAHEKKKKSSLFGKLKKLTKSSKSVDRSLDGSDIGSTGQLDIGSDSSLSTIDEKASRPLKDKLSGMFRKSGSTSRGNSLERSIKQQPMLPTDSTQRPLVNSSVQSNSSDISNSSKTTSKKPPSSAPVQRKVKK